MWYVYLIECRNGSWYAGITNDLDARYAAHAAGKGARYTRANPPVKLLGARPFPDRSAASRAEHEVKRLPKAKKLAWLTESSL
jgi:putative endonuclease